MAEKQHCRRCGNPRANCYECCLVCPDPRNCSGHTYSADGQSVPWYSWSEIRFCRFQMCFLIANLPILEIGKDPPHPQGSSYTDPRVRPQPRARAGFERPVELAAEVKLRLARTGIEGRLLRTEIEAGYDLDTFDPEAKTALWYISGWRRKRMSYKNWKKQRKYLRKTNTNWYSGTRSGWGEKRPG